MLKFFFRKTILSHLTFYAIFNIKKKYIKNCPFIYWLNGRWFLQIVDRAFWNLYPFIHYILYSLVLILYLKCGGGGCNVFLTFYAIYNISRKIKFWECNYFSFNVFFVFFYAGNIENCPFTYWLNGRWFLQIVDIKNFNMRLEILKSAPSLTG